MSGILVGGFQDLVKHIFVQLGEISPKDRGENQKHVFESHHLKCLKFFISITFFNKNRSNIAPLIPVSPLQITTCPHWERHLSLHQWPAARGLTFSEFHLEHRKCIRYGTVTGNQRKNGNEKEQGIHYGKLTARWLKNGPGLSRCISY